MTTEATETTIQVTEPEGNTEQEKLSNAGHENVASTEPAMATLDPQQVGDIVGGADITFSLCVPFAYT